MIKLREEIEKEARGSIWKTMDLILEVELDIRDMMEEVKAKIKGEELPSKNKELSPLSPQQDLNNPVVPTKNEETKN